MSTNLPESQPSEEVDLGQLFKLIGKAFDRLFKFIGGIFNKLFLAFVWCVFFTKRHLIILAIAGTIGVVLGVVKQKTEVARYKSTIVIKQNYNTGEHLYNTIEYFNSLIDEKDSVTLGNVLNLKPQEANLLVEFEIESVLDENQKLKLFDNYTKEIDSTLASGLKFKDYLDNSKEYEHRFQRIALQSKSKHNFNKVFNGIINSITTNNYFKNEQKKDLAELDRKEVIVKESLSESDSLQKVYKVVLEKTTEKVTGGTTSITFEGNDDKSVTKEYELFQNNLLLRRELVDIERKKENLAEIIEVISRQQDIGTLDNKGKVFGFETNKMIAYSTKLILVTFIVLLLIAFVRYLERFKDKV